MGWDEPSDLENKGTRYVGYCSSFRCL